MTDLNQKALNAVPRRPSSANVARFAVPGVLVLLIIIFSVALPSSFLTAGNWASMVQSQAVLLILALAVTMPLRVGDFDLSIGAIAALSSTVTAVMAVNLHLPAGLAIAIGLLSGVMVGVVNCIAVIVIGIDAFIATLATMTIVTGLTLIMTNTTVVYNIPDSIVQLARWSGLALPASAYYGWIIAAVLFYVYEMTPFGRSMLFVRGNQQAARLVGLPVNRIRVIAFLGSALLSSFAGVLLLGTIGAADPGIGAQYLLQPYAAAFLGATAIQLGRFNVIGTILGLYLIVVGVTGLQLLGASSSISQVFYGGVLLIAVGAARLASRRNKTSPVGN
ncbi:MAG: ABC transporter permease [Actinomycetota bacterium]